MARAVRLRPTDHFPYIPLADRGRPDEEQTEFVLRPLTLDETKRVKDCLIYSDGGQEVRGLTALTHLACKLGIVGVNPAMPLRDDDGRPVPYVPAKNGSGQCSDAFLARIPDYIRTEISRVVRGEEDEDEEPETEGAAPPSTLEKSEPSHDSAPEESAS